MLKNQENNLLLEKYPCLKKLTKIKNKLIKIVL